jgi:small GTP-binding protein
MDIHTKENQNPFYKIVLIGDSCVGKSCIMDRYVNNRFTENQEVTIGASFATKDVIVDKRQITLQMWDTAGQERYRSLTPMYYRNAMGAIIVYDITNKISFDNAKIWIEEIKKYRQEECKIIMLGNKIDLEHKRQVANNVYKEFVKQNIRCIETSAKTGFNIDYIFEELSKMIDNDNKKNGISLDKEQIQQFNRCC